MTFLNCLVYLILVCLVGTAFMVIYAKHAVFSLFFLIVSFLLSALLLFAIDCEFLALIFIIVYVGAISVLFLFSVMLLDSKLNNLLKSTMQYFPIGFIIGGVFCLPILYRFIYYFYDYFSDGSTYFDLHHYEYLTENFRVHTYDNVFPTIDYNFFSIFYSNWRNIIDATSDIHAYGQVLYSYFFLQFLMVGLILLLVLVGIAHLTTNTYPLPKITKPVFKKLTRGLSVFE